MERKPKTYYRYAKKDLEMLEVVCQPRGIAGIYRMAARKMEKAGNYLDAPELAVEYRRLARQAILDGKESLYHRACEQMSRAQNASERRLAIDMLRRIRGYRDADALAREFEKQNRREELRAQVRSLLYTAAGVLALAAAAILFA